MKLITITALLPALAAAAPVRLTGRTDAPSGNKKGLAYNNKNVISKFNGGASWAYNWDGLDDHLPIQQIPMVHNPGGTEGVMDMIKGAGAPYVLGYNECDETYANGGAQHSPGAARSAWADEMIPFADAGAQLVCPAITSWDTGAGHTGGPAGLQWLEAFVGDDPAPLRCAAQALHWYGDASFTGAEQAGLFLNYVDSAHARVDHMFHAQDFPLWLTEFAPLPRPDARVLADFLAVVMPELDKRSFVARYSPFMAEEMTVGGTAHPRHAGDELNEAGRMFIGDS